MSRVATVVVVNWNGAHLLRSCLPAILAQTLSGGRTFETVVVDNASSDDSLALLAREFPWVRVVRNSENLGFSGGNNVVLREVTTPYVALLNNDAVAGEGWLEALLAPFEEAGNEDLAITASKGLFAERFLDLHLETPAFHPETRDHRELGVILHAVRVDGRQTMHEVRGNACHPAEPTFTWSRSSGTLLVPLRGPGPWRVTVVAQAERVKPLTLRWLGRTADFTIRPVRRQRCTIDVPTDATLVDFVNNAGVLLLDSGHGADRGIWRRDDGRYDEACDVFGGCGNGMALRVSAGREVDWFDERFFAYYEDVDLSWRLRARGWRAHYVPDARLRHEHSASTGRLSDFVLYHSGRNHLVTVVANAPLPLAIWAVLRFPVDTIRIARHSPGRRRHVVLSRGRQFAAFAKLAPHALAKRREVRRTATVSRRTLSRGFTSHQAWLRGED